MARSRYKLDLDVDERTKDMSAEALYCRAKGHKWKEAAQSRRRFLELIRDGLAEDDQYCENGCAGTWRIVYRAKNGEVVEEERKYPRGAEYLMPKGSGRLDRSAARVAHFARKHPNYA